MICKVFYSWQSDLPSKTNRGFIEDALEKAARSIRSDNSIEIEPVIDRDTSGVPGVPDIASTILGRLTKPTYLYVMFQLLIKGQSHARFQIRMCYLN